MRNWIFILSFLVLSLVSNPLLGQNEGDVLDKMVAVVGNEIVLESEVEGQRDQAMKQGMSIDASTDCGIFEQLMRRKLILHQAKLDSVTVSNSRVQTELDRRLRYFIGQIGSEEKLEEFYGMSVEEIRSNFRPMIREQMMMQRMQQTITSDVNITPSDVKEYFESIPKDSIPAVQSKVRVAHIVSRPSLSEKSKEKAKKELQEYREDIVNGESSFSVIATLYSDDPGSAENGGDLGYVERGEMVPEFESVVFNLEKNEVSKVFRSEHGYHIAEMLDRKGKKIKVRHILLKPEVSSSSLDKARKELDSVRYEIKNDTLDFEEAARLLSDDEDTRKNGGMVVNQRTGSSWFTMEQVEPELFFTIDKMEKGEISNPVIMKDPQKGKAYRLIKLLERTKPHKANLEDDYDMIKKRAKQQKEDERMEEWFQKKFDKTYVKINASYRDCDFQYDWLKEQ